MNNQQEEGRTMAEYRPVPVSTAKAIADEFEKATVVIVCWDRQHELTHVTTYGETAFDKENAAAAGQICAKALGRDLGSKQEFEDFHRDYDPAMLREAEELFRLIRARQGTNPPLLQAVERWLKARGRGLRQG